MLPPVIKYQTHYHLHPFHFVLFKVKDLVAKQHPTNKHTHTHTLCPTPHSCSVAADCAPVSAPPLLPCGQSSQCCVLAWREQGSPPSFPLYPERRAVISNPQWVSIYDSHVPDHTFCARRKKGSGQLPIHFCSSAMK